MSLLDTVTDNVKVTEKAIGESSPQFTDLLDRGSNRIIDSMKSLPGNRELQALGFPSFDEFMQPAQGPVVRDHRQEQQNQGSYDQGNVRNYSDEWSGQDTNYNQSAVRDHRHEQYGNDYDQPGRREHRHESYGYESGYDRHEVRDHRHESCGYDSGDLNNYLAELFGNQGNPGADVLGGTAGFEQSMKAAMDLLSGHPENLLKDLTGIGGGGSGSGDGGGGGIFGKLFSGIKGLLGGGGGDKGGGLLGGVLGGILGGGSDGGSSGGGGLLGSLLPVALEVAPYLL